MRRSHLVMGIFALLTALTAFTFTPAQAAPSASSPGSAYAPLNRPGPKLSVPIKTLAAALECHGRLRNSRLEPVLLDPGTSLNPRQNYSWNWERAFNAQGRPWCALTMPHQALDDIQASGEYIVYGIRRMHAAAGRKIAVMGHSQGGMSMRWALRFWPDVRPMVDDVIGLAPDNHGSTNADPLCVEGRSHCTPQGWQQRSISQFMVALNSRAETFAGISYTEIYTHTDEVVAPSTGSNPSAALHTGAGSITNVATQDICPADMWEHMGIATVDPVAYALAMDALTHRGPAKPSRIPRSVCGETFQPGYDPLSPDNANYISAFPHMALLPIGFVNLAGAPELAAEPPLRCYVYATGRCP